MSLEQSSRHTSSLGVKRQQKGGGWGGVEEKCSNRIISPNSKRGRLPTVSQRRPYRIKGFGRSTPSRFVTHGNKIRWTIYDLFSWHSTGAFVSCSSVTTIHVFQFFKEFFFFFTEFYYSRLDRLVGLSINKHLKNGGRNGWNNRDETEWNLKNNIGNDSSQSKRVLDSIGNRCPD